MYFPMPPRGGDTEDQNATESPFEGGVGGCFSVGCPSDAREIPVKPSQGFTQAALRRQGGIPRTSFKRDVRPELGFAFDPEVDVIKPSSKITGVGVVARRHHRHGFRLSSRRNKDVRQVLAAKRQ